MLAPRPGEQAFENAILTGPSLKSQSQPCHRPLPAAAQPLEANLSVGLPVLVCRSVGSQNR